MDDKSAAPKPPAPPKPPPAPKPPPRKRFDARNYFAQDFAAHIER